MAEQQFLHPGAQVRLAGARAIEERRAILRIEIDASGIDLPHSLRVDGLGHGRPSC